MRKMIYALMALVIFCGTGCSSKKKLSSKGKCIVTISGKESGHDYVDLGLPSGTKWATCNVGATKPTEYGDYFAWGETKPKEEYSWSTYKWCKGRDDSMTKYNFRSDFGTVDNKDELEAEDDAATANWGSAWRMPTTEEQRELREGCDWEWVKNFIGSGVNGRLGTSKKNGATIFLPAAGFRDDTDLNNVGEDGLYWSSSSYPAYSVYSIAGIITKTMTAGYACYLDFSDGYVDESCDDRDYGQSVRAVLR